MKEPKRPSSSGEVSRRSFLKTSSVAVGGALLAGLSAERSAYAAGDETIRVALVGCGGRGRGAAAQALSTKGNVRLVAAADAFKDSLENGLKEVKAQVGERVEVPDDHKFVGLDAYKHAISVADVVILATPPGFRPFHFEEAIRQGKHVFMEKPVASDPAGVRRVLAAAEEAKKKNLKVGVGLQRRHQKPYLETIQRLHDGAIGDIVSMRCYWNDGGVWVRERKALEAQFGRKLTEMEYQVRNWYYFTWLSGDHICEQHIHNLDVINWVKNAYPVRCHGMGGREVRKGKDFGEIFDHHAVEYEYADGSRSYSQCRHIRGCWSNVSEHVVGTKGSCDVSGATIRGENAWRYRPEAGPNGRPLPHNPYQTEHDDLFDAIRNNKPFNEAEYGAKSTMTAIMGRMATYSGSVIEWDKALNSEIVLTPDNFSWDAMPKVLPDSDGYYPVPVPGVTKVL